MFFFDRFKQQTYAKDEALLDLVMGIYNKDTKVLTFAQHKLSIDKHRLSSLNMAMYQNMGIQARQIESDGNGDSQWVLN